MKECFQFVKISKIYFSFCWNILAGLKDLSFLHPLLIRRKISQLQLKLRSHFKSLSLVLFIIWSSISYAWNKNLARGMKQLQRFMIQWLEDQNEINKIIEQTKNTKKIFSETTKFARFLVKISVIIGVSYNYGDNHFLITPFEIEAQNSRW